MSCTTISTRPNRASIEQCSFPPRVHPAGVARRDANETGIARFALFGLPVDVDVRVPDDLPDMAVRVVEIAGIAAERAVARRVGDCRPGSRGLRHDRIDLFPRTDVVAEAELDRR